MKRSIVLAAVSFALASPASGQTGLEDCRKIHGNAERLACYDKLPLGAPKAATAAKAAPAEDPIIAAAKAATIKLLRDPDSAKFSNLKAKTASDGAKGVCGEVNAKNAMGGMSGPQLLVYDGKIARVMVSDAGAGNPTSFDRQLVGITLGETLRVYDRFCK
jgi:hypothetical protein